MDKRYKATIGSNKHFLSDEVVLLISLGKEYYNVNKLAAVIDLINRQNVRSCKLVLADTLQRHNYLINHSEDKAYRTTLEAGCNWLNTNSGILAKLIAPLEVLRWDALLNNQSYKRYRERLEIFYTTESAYKSNIDKTIHQFMRRKYKSACLDNSFKEQCWSNCLNYILEEIPIIMPIFQELGFNSILYPKKMTSAMSYCHENFLPDNYLVNPKWIDYRLKKKSPLVDLG